MFDARYVPRFKPKNRKNVINKNEYALNTISSELNKSSKILANNYSKTKFTSMNDSFFNKNKLFRDIKLFGLTKNKTSLKQKRNYSGTQVHGMHTVNSIKTILANEINNNLHNGLRNKTEKKIINSSSLKSLIKKSANMNYGLFTLQTSYGFKNNNHKIISSIPYKNHVRASTVPNNKNNSIVTNEHNDKIKISDYKKEISNLKFELQKKNSQIKKLNTRVAGLQKNLDLSNKNFNTLNEKYSNLKEQYKDLLEKNSALKNMNDENIKQLTFLQQKEIKLMQVIYLIREKGIDINSVLADVNKLNSENESERSNLSGFTVYFPDKIKMKNITKDTENDTGFNMPDLDFNQVPEYSSCTNSEEEVDIGFKPKPGNMTK